VLRSDRTTPMNSRVESSVVNTGVMGHKDVHSCVYHRIPGKQVVSY